MQQVEISSSPALNMDAAVDLSAETRVNQAMERKQKVLEILFPKAVLQAMTSEARSAVPPGRHVNDLVPIHAFPFRVGRESRTIMVDNKMHRIERPAADDEASPNNDMYLMDTGHLLQISREHFVIEENDSGYVLVDRGSKCGVTVSGNRVGGHSGVMRVPLQDGDVIAIGTRDSRYLYTFMAGFDRSRW